MKTLRKCGEDIGINKITFIFGKVYFQRII